MEEMESKFDGIVYVNFLCKITSNNVSQNYKQCSKIVQIRSLLDSNGQKLFLNIENFQKDRYWQPDFFLKWAKGKIF